MTLGDKFGVRSRKSSPTKKSLNKNNPLTLSVLWMDFNNTWVPRRDRSTNVSNRIANRGNSEYKIEKIDRGKELGGGVSTKKDAPTHPFKHPFSVRAIRIFPLLSLWSFRFPGWYLISVLSWWPYVYIYVRVPLK